MFPNRGKFLTYLSFNRFYMCVYNFPLRFLAFYFLLYHPAFLIVYVLSTIACQLIVL